ncbi:MAG TPA: tRNA (guanosine(37)-N1)-methyltransferase TrmD [Gammaproteobacteria bacterium]|nr:tRNA (guanosine(37)-N1)-methyltransferase TrmD [Gammaproteobacteria bacterium]
MQIAVVTLFPRMIEAVLEWGVIGRAVQRGLLRLTTIDPREFAQDAHRTVDDRPYGGGPGMVMKVAPLREALGRAREALPAGSPVVVLSPQGRLFDQDTARDLAGRPGLVLLAGRYEGIDERLMERDVDIEVSIGDYVLSGGEIPALAVIDAVTRLLPGVLGHPASAGQDSFAGGLLDCPHYTRPEEIDGQRVPEVLLGGDHRAVRRWRLAKALERTWRRRPELIDEKALTEEQRMLLDEVRRQET